MARWPELDGLLHLGLSARSVKECFEAMDIDGDGNITVCLFPCVMFDDLRYLYFHSQPQRMMLLLTLVHVLVLVLVLVLGRRCIRWRSSRSSARSQRIARRQSLLPLTQTGTGSSVSSVSDSFIDHC